MTVKTMSGTALAARSRWPPLRLAAPAGKRVVWVYAITDDLGAAPVRRAWPGSAASGSAPWPKRA